MNFRDLISRSHIVTCSGAAKKNIGGGEIDVTFDDVILPVG